MKLFFSTLLFIILLTNNLQSDSYYFGYGSNLNKKLMFERVGECEFIGIALLPNYNFSFNKKGKKGDHVFANIEQQWFSCVYGAVYKLTDEQFAKLDKIEGYKSFRNPSNHYEKREVVVDLKYDARTIRAIAYVASNKYRVRESVYKPTEVYLKTILEGASEVQLPQRYIDYIQAKAQTVTYYPYEWLFYY